MTVELCRATVSSLRGNTVLTELSLVSCGINAEETSHLAQALCDITTLRVLNLSGNTVNSQGTRHLGKLSGGILGYGLTCNIRLCQFPTSNRGMSIVQNSLGISRRTKPIVLARYTDAETPYLPTTLSTCHYGYNGYGSNFYKYISTRLDHGQGFVDVPLVHWLLQTTKPENCRPISYDLMLHSEVHSPTRDLRRR